MLILPGSLALSAFRQTRLLQDLKALLPKVIAVHARFVHLVDGQPDAEGHCRLEELLQYGRVISGCAAAWHYFAVVIQGNGHRPQLWC